MTYHHVTPSVEPLLQRNCRWIVRVCGRTVCKPGKLPTEFRSREAATKAGEKLLALYHSIAGV